MRFLVDEDVFHCLRFVLDEWGHDADHVSLRSDLLSKDDDTILRQAAAEGRVVITFNTPDDERLHKAYQVEGRSHAGVLCCRQYETYAQFSRLLDHMRNLLKTETEASLGNAVRYLHTY